MIYRWTWDSRGMQKVIRNTETAPPRVPITFDKFYYEAVVNQKVEYFNSYDIETMTTWYKEKFYEKGFDWENELLMTRYMEIRKGLLVAELALLQSFLLKKEIPVGNTYLDFKVVLPILISKILIEYSKFAASRKIPNIISERENSNGNSNV